MKTAIQRAAAVLGRKGGQAKGPSKDRGASVRAWWKSPASEEWRQHLRNFRKQQKP